jgi:thiamine-phosphate pyrophosphorylase
MHKIFNNYYYFIQKNQSQLIDLLPKNTTLIYRDYQNPININELINLKKICHKKNKFFFLSNNIRLAIKLDLDGAYIPAFNKSFSHNSYNLKKKFKSWFMLFISEKYFSVLLSLGGIHIVPIISKFKFLQNL